MLRSRHPLVDDIHSLIVSVTVRMPDSCETGWKFNTWVISRDKFNSFRLFSIGPNGSNFNQVSDRFHGRAYLTT